MSSSKAEVDLGKFAFGRKKEKHNDDHKKASEKEDSVDLGQFDPAHWGSPTSSSKKLFSHPTTADGAPDVNKQLFPMTSDTGRGDLARDVARRKELRLFQLEEIKKLASRIA